MSLCVDEGKMAGTERSGKFVNKKMINIIKKKARNAWPYNKIDMG